jgi:hypothetical protein
MMTAKNLAYRSWFVPNFNSDPDCMLFLDVLWSFSVVAYQERCYYCHLFAEARFVDALPSARCDALQFHCAIVSAGALVGKIPPTFRFLLLLHRRVALCFATASTSEALSMSSAIVGLLVCNVLTLSL